MTKDFATYTQETGGRALLLFLLFGLAIYEFVNAGFSAFALVCLSPLIIIAAYVAFKYPNGSILGIIYYQLFRTMVLVKIKCLPSAVIPCHYIMRCWKFFY